MSLSTHNVAEQSHDVSESGVDSPQAVPIVVKRPEANGSFFAEWFKKVDPNVPIKDYTYFWPTGSPLDPDNFASEEELDAHLNVSYKLEEGSSSDPFNLSLALDFDESGDESADESAAQTEEDLDALDPLPLVPVMSDWTKMPAILPPLSQDTDLSATELTSNPSDWDEMPEILPPLPQTSFGLSVPDMTQKTSDFLYVPQVIQGPPQPNLWDNSGVEQLQDYVVPYVAPVAPTNLPLVQASGFPTGVVPVYQTTVYHLPCIALGILLPSFI